MSRLSDRNRVSPEAPLKPPIPARFREHDDSQARAVDAPETEKPESGENAAQAPPAHKGSRAVAVPGASPAPGGSAACGDDDRMSSRAGSE
jgi:hypothetical protein